MAPGTPHPHALPLAPDELTNCSVFGLLDSWHKRDGSSALFWPDLWSFDNKARKPLWDAVRVYIDYDYRILMIARWMNLSVTLCVAGCYPHGVYAGGWPNHAWCASRVRAVSGVQIMWGLCPARTRCVLQYLLPALLQCALPRDIRGRG